MNKNIKVLFFSVGVLLVACKSKQRPDELNYMQNVENIATEYALKNSIGKIQNGDQLAILISAKDQSVVKPFNQNYTASESSQYTLPSSNLPTSNVINNTAAPTYTVDDNGQIDFPVLGKINVSGKNITDVKDDLKDRLSNYVVNPIVNVKISNYKVTILGEVNRPGQYTIPDGQSTILSALGLAGDVTMYARRDNILLVRTEDGQVKKERINIIDGSFINSPYFQLKQNDVIYVASNEKKGQIARQDPNTNIYIALAGTIIGLAGIFITIFKK